MQHPLVEPGIGLPRTHHTTRLARHEGERRVVPLQHISDSLDGEREGRRGAPHDQGVMVTLHIDRLPLRNDCHRSL
jgi:hypothetical protein